MVTACSGDEIALCQTVKLKPCVYHEYFANSMVADPQAPQPATRICCIDPTRAACALRFPNECDSQESAGAFVIPFMKVDGRSSFTC
jgi:hypothetical protein